MPLVGFSDDFVALTAVLVFGASMTPSIRTRAERKPISVPFFNE